MARKKPPTNKQLRKRANRQARQGAAADQAALDRARSAARRTYRTELGASKGAKRANMTLLNEAASSIPGNIHGLALKQIQSDIAGRMEDSRGMVKYDRAGLRQDLRSALTDIDEQQAALDAGIAADAQSILQESIKRQREKRQEAIEKRTKYDREVQSALAEIRNAVSKTRGDSITAHNVERKALARDPGLRRRLIDYLVTSQDVSLPAAKKAVSEYAKRREGTKRDNYKKVKDQVNYGVGAVLGTVTGRNADQYFDDLPWRRTYGPDDWGG